MPSRCNKSMRLRPNALTLTSACVCVGFGRSKSLMKSASMPPLPFLMSSFDQQTPNAAGHVTYTYRLHGRHSCTAVCDLIP